MIRILTKLRSAKVLCRMHSGLRVVERNTLRKLALLEDSAAATSAVTEMWLRKHCRTQIPPDYNLPSAVASVCLGPNGVGASLTVKLVEAVSGKDTLLAGYLEIVNVFVDSGNLDAALRVYSKVCRMNSVVDKSTMEKLLLECVRLHRLDAVDVVMRSQSVTSSMMVALAEPLILSGQMGVFADYLSLYLAASTLPSSPHVAVLIKAIEVARLRRALAAAPDLSRAEVDAVNRLYSLFESYHLRLAEEDPSASAGRLPSVAVLKQLFDSERLFFQSEPSYPFREPQYAPANYVPNLVRSRLLVEERFSTDRPSNPRLSHMGNQFTLRDLTHEFSASHPEAHRLYSGALFPGEHELETDRVAELMFMERGSAGAVEQAFRGEVPAEWVSNMHVQVRFVDPSHHFTGAGGSIHGAAGLDGEEADHDVDGDDREDDEDEEEGEEDEYDDDQEEYEMGLDLEGEEDEDGDDNEEEDDQDEEHDGDEDDQDEEFQGVGGGVYRDGGSDLLDKEGVRRAFAGSSSSSSSSRLRRYGYHVAEDRHPDSRRLWRDMAMLGRGAMHTRPRSDCAQPPSSSAATLAAAGGALGWDLSSQLDRDLPGFFLEFHEQAFFGGHWRHVQDVDSEQSIVSLEAPHRIQYRDYRRDVEKQIFDRRTQQQQQQQQQRESAERESCDTTGVNELTSKRCSGVVDSGGDTASLGRSGGAVMCEKLFGKDTSTR